MKYIAPLTAILAALAIAAGPAAAKGPKTAYFRVTVSAQQHVTWSENLTGRTCDPNVSAILSGKGTSSLELSSYTTQSARITQYGSRVSLQFAPGPAPELFVKGKLTRQGTSAVHLTGPLAKKCPSSPLDNPPPPDCGTRTLPYPTKLAVEYVSPRDWSFTDPAPGSPSMVLLGPNVDEWAGRPPYSNCPGISADNMLAGPIMFNEAIHTRAVALSPKKVFNGKIKSFTVADRYSKTMEEIGPLGGAVISGTKPVTANIDWKLNFTRVKRRPIGF
jgi:hypothetical protein